MKICGAINNPFPFFAFMGFLLPPQQLIISLGENLENLCRVPGEQILGHWEVDRRIEFRRQH